MEEELNEQRGYRAELGRLKREKIDPDGKGSYYKFEINLEKVLFANYQKHKDSLDQWEEANQQLKDNAKNIYNRYFVPNAKRMIDLASTMKFGIPITKILVPKDPDEVLSESALSIRKLVRKAWWNIKGVKWAKLAEANLSANEEIGLLRVDFRLNAAAIEAQFRDDNEELKERLEEEIEKIQKEIDDLTEKLRKRNTENLKDRAALKEIKLLKEQIDERNQQKEGLVRLNDKQTLVLQKQCAKKIGELGKELVEKEKELQKLIELNQVEIKKISK